MKIAISVPDRVFRAAERAAKRMRVPRSQFYSRAVEAYLRQASARDITARLNEVYSKEEPELEFVHEAARRTALRNSW